MTSDLHAAVQRLTCTFCLGNGALHHRIANPRFATEAVSYTETHYPCPRCAGSGMKAGA